MACPISSCTSPTEPPGYPANEYLSVPKAAAQDHGLLFPEELLEKIVNQVERPRDLLSLALSCRKLHRIIIPDYLFEHDHASVHLHDQRKWRLLGANARRIRSLRIVLGVAPSSRTSSRFHNVLSTLTGGQTGQGMELERTVELMARGLRSVEMDCLMVLPETSNVPARRNGPSDKAFALLAQSTVTKLIYRLGCAFQPTVTPTWDTLHKSMYAPLWRFSDLLEFTLTTEEGPNLDASSQKKMMDMLVLRCPQLEKLTLHNPKAPLRPLFERGSWPSLSHLDVFGKTSDLRDPSYTPITTQPHPVHEFFKRNQCISHLRLRMSPIDPQIGLDISIIGNIRDAPRLRVVEVEPKCAHYIPPETARQLIRLSTFKDLQSGYDSGWYTHFTVEEMRMPDLRVLSVGGVRLEGNARQYASVCLQVESLDYRIFDPPWQESIKTFTKTRADWVKIASLFPNITRLRKSSDKPDHFMLVKFNETKVFEELVQVAHKLEFVAVEDQWYRLVWKEGCYRGCVAIKSSDVPPEPEHWGSGFGL